MITLYIIVTYLLNLGMMISSFKDASKISTESWFVLSISPITCPIIIGITIADKQ
jgi:hypothetical protein